METAISILLYRMYTGYTCIHVHIHVYNRLYRMSVDDHIKRINIIAPLLMLEVFIL